MTSTNVIIEENDIWFVPVRVINNERKHERPWSGHICIASTWRRNSMWAQSLISSTTSMATASWDGWRMVVPSMKMVHGWKGKANFSTRAIPGVAKSSIHYTATGAWSGRMIHRSKISNIWTGVTSRWYGCVFSKDCMLARDIMICISQLITSSPSTRNKRIGKKITIR